MALRKNKAAKPAVKPEPTLSERLDAAVSRKSGAEGLVAAGASALAASAADLDNVAQAAFDEAARLSTLGNDATAQATEASQRATQAQSLLG